MGPAVSISPTASANFSVIGIPVAKNAGVVIEFGEGQNVF
jgi:hypothetical protein